ncbi:MAG: phosphatidate cytidylyltransferase [Steroidobacteraceae bacterium]
MKPSVDLELLWLVAGIVAVLAAASLIGWLMQRRQPDSATVSNLNARIRAWWAMVVVFTVAIATAPYGSLVMFALVSFMAMREFAALLPARRADHRAMFLAFFVFLPLQYLLVGINWYGLFALLIPVYAYLLLPLRQALSGDTQDFLARTSMLQWMLMITVFCVSHAPALLMLDIEGYAGQNAKLLLFLVLVTEMSDVLQYVFGKLFGKRHIVAKLSPGKTLEGYAGGGLSAVALGAALWWATPFSPWQAAAFALLIVIAGISGGLVMSAVKRDRGVKDFGTAIEGHGGVLDRIDSLCFAAPLFFHVTRFFFA